MRPALQFSHANGFPASTYDSLFVALAPHYRIDAVQQFGHDERFPVTDGWPHLVDQLLLAMAQRGEPVWLVGHSLGGLLSLEAAYRVPAQVLGVVMLDSPLLSASRSLWFWLAKRFGQAPRLLPIAATLKRRCEFDSRAAALAHFSAKPRFARFDPQVLEDYLGPPQPAEAPFRMPFDARIEAEIYRTIPHHLWRLMHRPKPAPIGFLAGTHSRESALIGLAATGALVGPAMGWIDGTHLFPMERPRATAEAIHAMITSLTPPLQ